MQCQIDDSAPKNACACMLYDEGIRCGSKANCVMNTAWVNKGYKMPPNMKTIIMQKDDAVMPNSEL